MAGFYVTGPCDIFVGSLAGPAVFVGHAERTPSVQIKPSFSPVYCDLFGQRVPADFLYDGEEAMISADVTRFNESTYAFMAQRPDATIAGARRGSNIPGDIGTLMVAEGYAYSLFLRFPYAAKPAFSTGSGGAMPAGYRFLAAFLEGPDDLGPLGTTNRRIRLNWRAARVPSVVTGSSFGAVALTLYDHDMSRTVGVPAL